MYIDYGFANVAMVVLQTGAQINDKDSRMWNGLGRAHYELGQYQEAIDTYSVSATMPVGKFTIKAGYAAISSDLSGRDGSKFGFGGQYNLSKRTELYANVGKLQGDRFNGVEEKTTQFDLGVTHRF